MRTKNLYKALTRPPMIGGLGYEYFAIMATITSILFIGTGRFVFLLSAVPLFIIGRKIYSHDPWLVKCFFLKNTKTPRIKNLRFWHYCNTYDPMKTPNDEK